MKYIDEKDCYIDRVGCPGKAVLLDAEGVSLVTFDGDMTDAQIIDALRFANDVWAKGVKFGQELKAAEIRTVLGVAPIPTED
jgi:hypothetical protein